MTTEESLEPTVNKITPIVVRRKRAVKPESELSTKRTKFENLWLYQKQDIPYERVTEYGKIFYVEDLEKAIAILNHWTKNKYWVALDCETGCGWRFKDGKEKSHFYNDGRINKIYGSDPWTSPLYLIQASVKANEAVVFDVRSLIDNPEFVNAARDCFQTCRIIGHNLLFDASFLTVKFNCNVNTQFDTAIAYQMVNAGIVETVALKEVLRVLKNVKLNKDWQTQFLSLHPKSPIPLEAIDYAACDVFWLLDIAKELYAQLIEKDLVSVWETIERPLMPWVLRSMLYGVKVNSVPLINLDNMLQESIIRNKEILAANMGTVNYRSNQQLSTWYEQQKVELPRTPTGSLSMTSANLKKALKSVSEPNVIAVTQALLEIKKLEKNSGTYLKPLAGRFQNPITGRVHPYWRQNPTQTGRMSCADPSLMNIPSREAPFDKIRDAFESDAGAGIITADYSQIEVRILAEVSKEQLMLDVFIEAYEIAEQIKLFCASNGLNEIEIKRSFEIASNTNDRITLSELSNKYPQLVSMLEKLTTLDFHRRTAALLFHNGDYTKVTKEERSKAKSGTFGVIYGQREYGLSEKMGVSMDQAREFLEQYFNTFKNVAQWLNDMKLNAQDLCYTTTLSGRKRFYEITNLQDLYKKFYAIKSNEASAQQWERLCRAWDTDDIRTLARKVNTFQWKQAGRQGTNHPIQGLSADITKLATVLACPRLSILNKNCSILMWVHDEIVSTSPLSVIDKASEIQSSSMIEAARFYLKSCPIEVGVTLSNRWAK